MKNVTSQEGHAFRCQNEATKSYRAALRTQPALAGGDN